MPLLERLAAHTQVVGVVTQPDRPAGRGHRLVAPPVKVAAEALGLRIFAPPRLTGFADELAPLQADILAVGSYGRIVPPAVLALPRRGIAFNVHPSLLPLYRGATPLQSALRDGRTQTGVTIIAMDAGMDTGDILLQERTPIAPQETYGTLHDRLARRGAELLLAAVDKLVDGTLERVPQESAGYTPDEIAATSTRPLTKTDLLVDWSASAQAIVDMVRSLSPAPAARAQLGGQAVKIVAARIAQPDERELPVTTDGGMVHPAGDGGAVVVLRLVAPNRGSVRGAEYARSRRPA